METTEARLLSKIVEGLDIVGDRWSLMILREAFYGCNRFEQFRKNTGISRATLTRRLQDLIDYDVLYKRPIRDTKHAEYNLTPRGMGLFGASLIASQLETQWQPNDTEKHPPLVHTTCHHEFIALSVCEHCHQPVTADDIQWQVRSEGVEELKNLSSSSSPKRSRASKSGSSVAELIGDRWSLLLLIAGFLGITRFDDFQKMLNIAPGILNSRLKSLIADGMMERVDCAEGRTRHKYKLTAKGRSTNNFVLALRQWIVDGVKEPLPPPNMFHKQCGKPLRQQVVCAHCHEKPWPQDLVRSGAMTKSTL
ncbi:MAG: helix-turn-helix domain-containing protein [Candidatus Pelagadaptatus aseana]|uniref:winged helix-turn-helix transcriptional regulator n=1 Tax=Candidatus Pelagadaptatus aseana TaxID=3120508 RepID=UPI0039B1B56B